MKIEFIPREKAESIAQTKPFLLSQVTLASPQSRFIMITRPDVFRVIFDIAVIDENGEILSISDPALEKEVCDFLASEKRKLQNSNTTSKDESLCNAIDNALNLLKEADLVL